ncbi:MAG: hypothetical protein AAF824_01800 [Bacteroidota bacterium]
MTIRIYILCCGLFFLLHTALGQQTETFRLSLSPSTASQSSYLQTSYPLPELSAELVRPITLFEIQSWTISPAYVTQNPTGDTYLCRLEDQLEASMRVPVWVNTKDERYQRITTSENIKLLFKLVRF